MPDYPKEQLWELYKNLPEDLQKASFSEEVARNIQEICEKNGIKKEETVFEVSKNVGYVFLGLLPPNEFADILERELKIEKAKLISSEINRFVFLPVRKSLEALYGMGISSGTKPETPPLPSEIPQSKKEPERKEKPEKKDTYREPIE